MTPKSGLVVLCPGSSAPWRVVRAFAAADKIEEEALTFISTPGPSSLAPGSASAALCCTATNQQHTREACANLARLLAPGGNLYIYDVALVSGTECHSLQCAREGCPCIYLTWPTPMHEQDAPRQQAIQKELLLSGFADGRVDAFQGVPMVRRILTRSV